MRKCSEEQEEGRRQQCGGWRGEGDERRREQSGTLYSNPLVRQIKNRQTHVNTVSPPLEKTDPENKSDESPIPASNDSALWSQSGLFLETRSAALVSPAVARGTSSPRTIPGTRRTSRPPPSPMRPPQRRRRCIPSAPSLRAKPSSSPTAPSRTNRTMSSMSPPRLLHVLNPSTIRDHLMRQACIPRLSLPSVPNNNILLLFAAIFRRQPVN